MSLGAACAAAVALFWRAVGEVPLARIGQSGAEFIPHVQRQLAENLIAERGWGALASPFETLRALDGHYGGLLHLLGALWCALPGAPTHGDAVFAWSQALVLMSFLALLAGLALLARDEGSGATAPLWALAMPGLVGASRHYYYDLPMAACLVLAGALLLSGPGLCRFSRAAGAGVLTGAALLFKWAAGLYAAPLWLVALWRGGGTASWRQRLSGAALGCGAALAVTAPVATVSHGSFAFQVGLVGGQAAPPPGGARDLAEAMGIYGRSAIMDGLGPGMAGAALLAVTLLARRPGGRRILGVAAALSIPPFLFICAGVPAINGRYIMPLLPIAAALISAALATLSPGPRRALTAAALIAGAVQIHQMDGLLHRPGPAAVEARLATLEPWRPWWWTGARLDLPARTTPVEAAVEAAVAMNAHRGLALAHGPRELWQSPAWQYYLTRQVPGAPLSSLPAGWAPGDRVDAGVVVSLSPFAGFAPAAAFPLDERTTAYLYGAASLSGGAP